MTCALCGAGLPEGAAYCGSCGVAVGLTCPRCSASNNPRARRCGACGTELRRDSARPRPTRAPRESRRIVTVLFADIVGYTSMVESHAAETESVRALMQQCFDALASTVLDHGGIVEKFIGDAVCALFGAPAVHEDDPERALACALAMKMSIERINESARGESDSVFEPLNLRIGVSTGEVVGGTAEHAGQEQYSVTGDAVNTASRLQAAALPGQILISAATERIVRERFVLESAGEIKLKGKRSPIQAYVVTGALRDARPGGSDLVNRHREIEHLRFCMRLAAEGDPQLVEVTGDAGVGKSRLVDAFAERASPFALVCRGSCPPMAASPLHPFRSIASDLLGAIRHEAGENSGLEAVAGVLETTASGSPMATLEHATEQVASAIEVAVGTLCRAQPILLLVENVHRADADSLEVLQRLVGKVKHERLMLAWTRRSGEEMVLQADYSASFTRVSLKPLDEGDTERLMRLLLDGAVIPRAMERMLVERSAGNPLYIEAMIGTILEDGRLLKDPESSAIEIPTTVHGLIQSRLDSLPESQRLVAQEAAVAGREFDGRLLQQVDLFGIEVAPALEALDRRGMVEHVTGSTYRFRHVLTQEVCYDTMLQGLRAELHREIADAIPDIFPDRLLELAPVRADHYAKAGDTDRAVEVLVDAGSPGGDR